MLKQFTARLVERALQVEMSHHLGCEPGQRRPESAGSGPNGYLSKTLLTEQGQVAAPLDRDGSSSCSWSVSPRLRPSVVADDSRLFATINAILAQDCRGS